MSVPQSMIDAVPPGSMCVKHLTGSTWNDGGAWHTAIFQLPDGTFLQVKMDTDYRSHDLMIVPVRKRFVAVVEEVYEPVKGGDA